MGLLLCLWLSHRSLFSMAVHLWYHHRIQNTIIKTIAALAISHILKELHNTERETKCRLLKWDGKQLVQKSPPPPHPTCQQAQCLPKYS
jgi:hypothetical protein